MTKKHIVLFVLLALTAFSAFGQEAAATGGGVRWGVIGAAFVLGISAAAGAIGRDDGRLAAEVSALSENNTEDSLRAPVLPLPLLAAPAPRPSPPPPPRGAAE